MSPSYTACAAHPDLYPAMLPAKKTMTLNLTDAEMTVLEELCAKKDLNKTSVLRQALRLYQLVETRLEKGDKFFFEDEKSQNKSEVVML